MKTYYVAGLPYSDELWHFGIRGQKWGLRRYQNPDGTLTSLGKIHYGASKALKATGKAVGTGAKAFGKGAEKVAKGVGTGVKRTAGHVGDKITAKHKWMLSDEQLQKKIARAEMEKKYKDMLEQSKNKVSSGRRTIGEILQNSAKTVASTLVSAGAHKLADKLFKEEVQLKPSEQMAKAFAETWDNLSDKEKGRLATNMTDAEKSRFDKYAERVELFRRIEGGGGNGKKKGKK